MNEANLYRQAFILSLFTIGYNILEGLASVYFGIEEETLTLFGFGVDSFIEALSGLGIAHMIIRIRANKESKTDKFEITALKITGISFYLLSGGLVIGIVLRILNNETPKSTVPGIIIAIISIVVMLGLVHLKNKVGKKLNSSAILADASCTMICIYMSLIVLVSSFVYELVRINYIDILGTIGIIYFSIREGMESFAKAKGIYACSCDH